MNSFGGKGDDDARDVIGTSAGQAFVTGSFSQTVTFLSDTKKKGKNSEAVEVTASGDADVWLMMLDPAGDGLWVDTFGGTSATASGEHVTLDTQNNVAVTGLYSGSIALNDDDTTDSDSGIFAIQHTEAGDQSWAMSVSGDLSTTGLVADADDHLYLGGTLSGTVSFDDDNNDASLTATDTDGYICTLNSDGSFTSAELYGGSGEQSLDSLAIDGSDRLLLTGSFEGTFTFDGHSEVAAGGSDLYGIRLDTSGGLDWMMKVGSSVDDTPASITTDADSRAWLAGTFTADIDLDPTKGSDERSADGGSGVWVVQVSSGGP